MTRRADPERIYLARRAAMFGKLTRTRVVDELDAEHLISAWERSPEAQTLDRFTPAFWDEADRWSAERRARCSPARLARAYPTYASGSRSS